MPMLDASRNVHHVAGLQFHRRLAPFLIVAAARRRNENLATALLCMMDMPVVAARRFKSHVPDTHLFLADHVEIALAHEILGVGVVRLAHREHTPVLAWHGFCVRRDLRLRHRFLKQSQCIQRARITAIRQAVVNRLFHVFGRANLQVRADVRLELRLRSQVHENRHRQEFAGIQVEPLAGVVIAKAVARKEVVDSRHTALAVLRHVAESLTEQRSLRVCTRLQAGLRRHCPTVFVHLHVLRLEHAAGNFNRIHRPREPGVGGALVNRLENFFGSKPLRKRRRHFFLQKSARLLRHKRHQANQLHLALFHKRSRRRNLVLREVVHHGTQFLVLRKRLRLALRAAITRGKHRTHTKHRHNRP